jgi:colicin import membrane protein
MTAYVSAHMVNVPAKNVQGGKVARAHEARKGLLHEGARSLNDAHEQKWAADNPNIRPDFADQNIVMVQRQDANGEWALSEIDTSGEEESFIDYGDARVARLDRKVREGQVEVSSMAFHYPKDWCDEHPNEAQAVDEKTGKLVFDKFGDPVMVSRYTPKDQNEMRAYFQDCLDYLVTKLGSEENIHGAFIHLDERTPHMQVVFDSYRVSQKDPDKLAMHHSRIWSEHRDVRYADGTFVGDKDMSGKVVSGSAKMKKFHQGMRDYMADSGWEVSREHSENHDTHLTKDEYIAVENARKAHEQEKEKIEERNKALDENEEALELAYSENKKKKDELDKREEAIKEKEQTVLAKANKDAESIREQARRDVQQIRQRAEQDAKEKAKEEAEQQAQQIRAQAKLDADQIRKDANDYYTSHTSTADAEVDALEERKSTLEGEVSDLEGSKSSLERENEQLRQEKKQLELGDLVAEPDSVQVKLDRARTVISENILHLRDNGMTGQAVTDVINALGDVQEDENFKRLARENEEKQQSQKQSQNGSEGFEGVDPD